MIWRWSFWKSTIEIALASFSDSAVAIMSVAGLGLLDVDFEIVLSVAGLAGVVAILKAVGSSVVGDRGTPTIVRAPKPLKAAPAAVAELDEDEADADPGHDQPTRAPKPHVGPER